MKARTWFFAAGLVAAFGVGLVAPGVAASSQLASTTIPYPPSTPPAINGLPSVVTGSLPVTGGTGAQNYLTVALYKLSKSPGFWQAAAAVQAGTATSTQAATVSSVTSTHTMPGTKLATAGKVIGGAAAAISTFSIGTMIGNGIMEISGVDVNGLVCKEDAAGFLSILTGADCSQVVMDGPDFVPNYGATAGYAPTTWCATSGANTMCMHFYGITNGQPASYSGPPLAFNEQVGCWTTTLNGVLSTTLTGGSPRFVMTSLTSGQSLYQVSGGNFSGTTTGQGQKTACHDAFPSYPYSGSGSIPAGVGSGSLDACVTSCYTGSPGPSVAGTFPMLGVKILGMSSGTWVVSGTDTGLTTALSGNPVRTLRCVILGDDAIEYAASTVGYTEADGVLPQPNCPDLPAGVLMDTMTLWEDSADGSVKLWEETTTPEWDAAQALAPECISGTCMLDLQITSTGASCFQTPTECAAWFADPDKGSKYNCQYGTHAVDLAECNVYAPTFTEQAQSTGNWYADPDGNPIQAPAGSPVPGLDGGVFDQPGQDPTSDRQCFPTGWGVLNPIEWVFRPVQCALEWAFVPRPAVVQQVGTQVATAWSDTSIVQTQQLVNGLPALIPVGTSDCMGPPVTFAGTGEFGMDGTWYPLNACDEPMSGVAAFAKIAGVALLGVLAVFAVVRYFARAIGFVGMGKNEGAAD